MMLRDAVIDGAIRLGIDRQLRGIRAALVPQYRQQRGDDWKLRRLLTATLAPDGNAIDVGAYRGRVLEEIVAVAPRGHHLAYEPLPHLNQQLARRFPAVDVRLAAASNRNGSATFRYVRNMPARSGLRTTAYPRHADIAEITVRTERLDDALPVDFVPALLKIDVEGAEGLVIEGALETINRHRPAVIFEHGRAAAAFGTTPERIFDLLVRQAGLRIFDFDGEGPYSLDHLAEVCAADTRWDFVARG